MKKLMIITLFLGLCLKSVFVISQIPPGYYDSANGLSGSALKTALQKIIRNHTVRSYSQLWTDFQTTDKTDSGYVWDMYSNCTFVFGTDQDNGSGGTSECQFYNREHSMPNSWWGGTQDTMYTDLFHLIPTDKYVNNSRGNYCFGEVSSPTHTFGNGGKLGPCSFAGYSGTVFEPVDEYKGDFARNYFYLATRYESKIASWTSDMLAGNSYPVFTTWAVNLLLKWNNQDTVSQKEIDRNNAIYGIQHNRNPFIDHPEWVSYIWGPSAGIKNNTATLLSLNIFPMPSKGTISISSDGALHHISFSLYTDEGKYIYNKESEELLNNYTLDVSEISDGFYFLKIICDEGVEVKKVIVEKP